MATELIPAPPADLVAIEQVARGYQDAALSDRTWRAYRSDLRAYADWCHGRGLNALPAEPHTIALYLSGMASRGRKASTITRHLASISTAHKVTRIDPNPAHDAEVRATMAGIRRKHGTKPSEKAAAETALLRRMVATCPDTLAGRRDRALLLIGFAGAFRRSELVSLDVQDVEMVIDGLRIQMGRSKTDQEGQGTEKGIPFASHPDLCPVRAYRAWLERSDIHTGPLWRAINRHDQMQRGRLGDQAVAGIVKRAAKRAGLDPARFAGHSLRAGLATSAAAADAPEAAIMEQTGHRSPMMLRRYIRHGSLFRQNAAAYALGKV